MPRPASELPKYYISAFSYIKHKFTRVYLEFIGAKTIVTY